MVIFVPPEAPTTIFTRLSLSKMIVGHMEESGLLPTTNEQNHYDCFIYGKVMCLSFVLNVLYVAV